MTEAPLTEAKFCALLDKNGIKLEGAALQTALRDARHLQEQIVRLDVYLAEMEAGLCT